MLSASACSLLRFSAPYVVEMDPRRFDGIERLLLQFRRARAFHRTHERAAGDRPMIGALGVLQRLERGAVLALPVEPPGEPIDGLALRLTGALDAERIVGLVMPCPRDPLAFALDRFDAVAHSPNREGATIASAGSMRWSSSASATSCAVNGARSTPLR